MSDLDLATREELERLARAEVDTQAAYRAAKKGSDNAEITRTIQEWYAAVSSLGDACSGNTLLKLLSSLHEAERRAPTDAEGEAIQNAVDVLSYMRATVAMPVARLTAFEKTIATLNGLQSRIPAPARVSEGTTDA